MKFSEYKLSELLISVIDNRGKNPEKYYDSEKHPVLDNYLIKNKYYPDLNEVQRYIDEETYKNFLRGYIHKNMPIMTLVGNGIGNVTLCPNNESVILQNTIGFQVNEKINEIYLYYALLLKNEELKGLNRGSGQPSIKKTDVLDIKIKIPNMETQEKIVSILSNFDLTIESLKNENLIIQKIINKIFENNFADLNKIPNNWEIKRLDQVADFINGYGVDTNKMLDHYEQDTYKVFKMGNINIGGGINKEKTKSWIKKADCTGLGKYVTKKGDILMCMTDMKSSNNPLLGHTALIESDGEFFVNQRVGLIRCKEQFSYSYLYTMSNMQFFIRDIRSRANSGVQVNLSTSGICETNVVVPDKNTHDWFDKISSNMYEKIWANQTKIEKIKEIKEKLTKKLITGKIDILGCE